MGPGIVRSMREGFMTANRSWMGIGLVAAGWVLIGLFVLLMGVVSRIPPQLLEAPVTEQALPETPDIDQLSPQGLSDATTAPAAGQTNQISDLGLAPDPTASPDAPPEMGADTTTDTAAANAADVLERVRQEAAMEQARQEVAERERVAAEWLGRAWPLLVLIVLVLIAASTWLYGGQVGYLVKQTTGGRASVSDFVASGTAAFWPLLGSSLLSGGGTVVLLVVGILLAAAFGPLSNVLPGWLLTVLGLLLFLVLLVFLVWLLIRLAFWPIAVVRDRVGPIRGLRTSFRASRGHGWKVLGLVALMGVIGFAVSMLFQLLTSLGHLLGGVGVVIVFLLNVLGSVASLYLGFAITAALIRYFEDIRSQTPGPMSQQAGA